MRIILPLVALLLFVGCEEKEAPAPDPADIIGVWKFQGSNVSGEVEIVKDNNGVYSLKSGRKFTLEGQTFTALNSHSNIGFNKSDVITDGLYLSDQVERKQGIRGHDLWLFQTTFDRSTQTITSSQHSYNVCGCYNKDQILIEQVILTRK